jgi:archaellum biogenesis ATPase FlaH
MKKTHKESCLDAIIESEALTNCEPKKTRKKSLTIKGKEISEDLKKPDFTNVTFNGAIMDNKKQSNFSIKAVEPRNDEGAFIPSNFKFIKSHGGLHKGHIHVLMGRTTKGKSSLLLEVILENAVKGISSLLFLSEAKKEDIRKQVDEMMLLKKIPLEDQYIALSCIFLITEADFRGDDHYEPQKWLNALSSIAKEVDAKIVCIDNVSGIRHGNCTPEVQVEFMKYLNETTQRLNVPMIVAVHQAKSTDPLKELEMHDVRANQNFTSLPSYVYALNDFSNLDKGKRLLSILKSRIQGDSNGKYFDLIFKKGKTSGHYAKDREIPHNTAKNYFLMNKSLSKTTLKKS